MPRALDHIVWPARDLDALAEAFRSLGFTVGRRNRHPWGTVNHIIQFDGCFLELLGFADDYRSLPPDDPAFPFAGYCERFLAEAEAGAAMLVLRSDDAAADARAFARDGLGQGRVLPFSRNAQGADGTDRTVAFTVAFADLPDLGAFVCQQHRPENFWSTAAQRHANSAEGIAAVTLTTPEPAFMELGLRRFADIDDGQELVLANGCRLALHRFQGTPHQPPIGSIDVRVGNLEPLRRICRSNAVPVDEAEGVLSIDAVAGGGTRLRFVGADPA